MEFIEKTYQNITNVKPFDVIKTIKDRFLEISKEIIEKSEQPLDKNSFDNSNNKLIKLNNQNHVTLKKCLIDELGFSNLKANGFEPTYNYYKKDDKIIVRIEGPGNCNIKNTYTDYGGEYTILRIYGIKKIDKEPKNIEDCLFNSREFGEFSLDIPLKTEDYLIKNEYPNIRDQRGVLFLEYNLDKKKEGGKFEVGENDEI